NMSLAPIASGGHTDIPPVQVTGLTTNTCNEATVSSCRSAVCTLVKAPNKAGDNNAKSDDNCEVFITKVQIAKVCKDQVNNVNTVTITVSATGSEEALSNCTVTDTLFRNDSTCTSKAEPVTCTNTETFDLPKHQAKYAIPCTI